MHWIYRGLCFVTFVFANLVLVWSFTWFGVSRGHFMVAILDLTIIPMYIFGLITLGLVFNLSFIYAKSCGCCEQPLQTAQGGDYQLVNQTGVMMSVAPSHVVTFQ